MPSKTKRIIKYFPNDQVLFRKKTEDNKVKKSQGKNYVFFQWLQG